MTTGRVCGWAQYLPICRLHEHLVSRVQHRKYVLPVKNVRYCVPRRLLMRQSLKQVNSPKWTMKPVLPSGKNTAPIAGCVLPIARYHKSHGHNLRHINQSIISKMRPLQNYYILNLCPLQTPPVKNREAGRKIFCSYKNSQCSGA